MSNMRKKSPLIREKWLLGELDSEARAAFERDVSSVEREQLKQEDLALREELFAALPPNLLKARVNSKIAQSTKAARMFWSAAPAAAVVVASALLFLSPSADPTAQGHSPTKQAESSERIKGLAPRVVVYRQLEHSAEELRNGAEARARDVLQLGYVAGGRGYGVLLSIDGRGVVTLHAPRMPNADATLPDNPRTQLLERAYELDDAPSFERFFFVTSQRALHVNQILNAAEELAREPQRAMREPLKLAPNAEQSSVLLRKANSQ